MLIASGPGSCRTFLEGPTMADLKANEGKTAEEQIAGLRRSLEDSIDRLRREGEDYERRIRALNETRVDPPRSMEELCERAAMALVRDYELDRNYLGDGCPQTVHLDIRTGDGGQHRFSVRDYQDGKSVPIRPGWYRFFVFALPLEK